MFLVTAVSSHSASYKWPETNKHTEHRTQILCTETLFSFWYKQFQFISDPDLNEREMHVFLLSLFLHPEWMSLLL